MLNKKKINKKFGIKNLLKNNFNDCEKDKLKKFSLNFLSNFASISDIDFLMHQFTSEENDLTRLIPKYPSIKIKCLLKKEIEFYKIKVSATSIFQKVIYFFIPSLNDWAIRNAEKF